MKKLLLILSLICIRQVNAQCSVTITGDSICAGSCATLTASGALSYQWAPNPWMPSGATTSTISACVYNTTYTVTGYGAGGCVSTKTVSLSIFNPSLSATVINASCLTCNDGQIVASAYFGDSPFTYTWMPAGTVSEAGSTSTYLNAGPGTYTVCVSDKIGCTNCSIATVSVSTGTGINMLSTNAQFSIYPNPASDQLLIDANMTDKLTVDLYDVNGKLVLSQIINGRTSIDASSLNEGVYNISLQSNEGVVNKRLVIVR